MTTPEERTRNIVQAGAFLIELARDKSLPYLIRREAARLARHYPTTSNVRYGLECITQIHPEWTESYKWGPLHDSTRVPLPEPPEPECQQKPKRKRSTQKMADPS